MSATLSVIRLNEESDGKVRVEVDVDRRPTKKGDHVTYVFEADNIVSAVSAAMDVVLTEDHGVGLVETYFVDFEGGETIHTRYPYEGVRTVELDAEGSDL